MKTFTLSMRSLLLQPLRSGLAIIGIWIGITAVIWLVAMGNGVSQQAQDQIRDLGAKNVIVRTVKPSQNSSAAGGGMFLSYGLKRADFKKIAAGVPWVEQAVPIREMRKTVRNDQTEQEVRVVGLMIGIELSVEGTPVVSKCMDHRLLVNCTQGTVIRLLPAMNLTTAEVEEGCEILSEVIQSLGI